MVHQLTDLQLATHCFAGDPFSQPVRGWQMPLHSDMRSRKWRMHCASCRQVYVALAAVPEADFGNVTSMK